VFESIGTALADGEAGWDAFKDAAKGAIASVLEMIARQLIIKAIAAIPNFALAATFSAGAAAAYVAAGAVRAMAGGGVIDEPVMGVGQKTGQRYLLGEAGPEEVRRFGGGSSSGPIHVTVQMDGKPILNAVSKASRDGRVVISARSVR